MLNDAAALEAAHVATDADVVALPAAEAVAMMHAAVRLHGAGELEAPVRQALEFGGGAMVFTVGRAPDVAAGFRVYSGATDGIGEATVVFRPDGAPVGFIVGPELGRRRTGALGGVAAELCARPDSHTLGLVGAGEQAFTQLWAVSSVRDLRQVRVHSRNVERAHSFARRATTELGLEVEVMSTPRDAVRAADIVVLATPSPVPLIEAGWIAPGTHVHTLGPKGHAEGECPHTLVQAATVLVSDSPDQLAEMEGGHRPWTGGRKVVSLGQLAVGERHGRIDADDITLFASVGLAGTEVVYAVGLLERMARIA